MQTPIQDTPVLYCRLHTCLFCVLVYAAVCTRLFHKAADDGGAAAVETINVEDDDDDDGVVMSGRPSDESSLKKSAQERSAMDKSTEGIDDSAMDETSVKKPGQERSAMDESTEGIDDSAITHGSDAVEDHDDTTSMLDVGDGASVAGDVGAGATTAVKFAADELRALVAKFAPEWNAIKTTDAAKRFHDMADAARKE